MTTATFSDGTTDVYKGKRAVTAAWQITHSDRPTWAHSGHSLNESAAASTAASQISWNSKMAGEIVKHRGASSREIKQAVADCRAAYKVEIVSI
tara:strand:+ start:1029 stop:1310 length:282 start_codon:yes stop_codon:yes gene_type:complete